VELRCNGEVVARTEVGKERRHIATFDTTYVPGDLVAVALRGGEEHGRTVLRTAGETVQLALALDRESVRSEGDLAFVEISLVDADGLGHVCVDREVTVTVSGAGVLQGLGSANPCSTDDYTASTCTTFLGRALAVARATAEGVITVTVESAGTRSATVTITASPSGR
jgi:hypothetical protein